jgi:hypothetical protein
MTKFKERAKAIELRKEGKSYSEIKKLMRVSKSSLSLWLRNKPLTEEQVKKIAGNKERAIERFRETMRLKRENRLLKYYEKQRKIWLPLSERELFFAGLFLYWGEGNKASRHTISISNTDPKVLVFSLCWMTTALKIPKKSIKVLLQLYTDMDVGKTTAYWSRLLRIPRSQFNKPYIKNSTRSSIDQKGFGYGTCTLMAQSTVIKENLMMATKGIADFYSK